MISQASHPRRHHLMNQWCRIVPIACFFNLASAEDLCGSLENGIDSRAASAFNKFISKYNNMKTYKEIHYKPDLGICLFIYFFMLYAKWF